MAAKTVAENFKANIVELATVRTDWTADYATSLITRVDSAVETYLGIDSKKELRNATSQLTAIMHPAMRLLAERLKVPIRGRGERERKADE